MAPFDFTYITKYYNKGALLFICSSSESPTTVIIIMYKCLGQGHVT